MNTSTFPLRSSYDDLNLSVLVISPKTSPKAVVQFAHGMCEYKERYVPFMEFLCSQGYVCILHDHRGHGTSVKSEEDLGYFYSGGYEAVIGDVLTVNEHARKMFPDCPLYLFGHSMGSLAVRSFTKRHDDRIDGLIVCGSPSKNPAAGAGKILAKTIAAIKGERHRPALIQKIAFEGFNKKFSSEGTNAWLSTEKENVRSYNADPLCGYCFTCNGFIGLFDLMMDTYSSKGWKIAKPQLPVHFIAGSDDPCITSLKDFDAAVGHMKAMGYMDVTSNTYEGLRHEILNETGKEKVWKDIASLLDRWHTKC
ncbi:MAG: alpha/beta fold hydrolase [Bacteroidales bacterium]|nr:alpha/beta fold hydrolase [Bacteroidales bacterium]